MLIKKRVLLLAFGLAALGELALFPQSSPKTAPKGCPDECYLPTSGSSGHPGDKGRVEFNLGEFSRPETTALQVFIPAGSKPRGFVVEIVSPAGTVLKKTEFTLQPVSHNKAANQYVVLTWNESTAESLRPFFKAGNKLWVSAQGTNLKNIRVRLAQRAL